MNALSKNPHQKYTSAFIYEKPTVTFKGGCAFWLIHIHGGAYGRDLSLKTIILNEYKGSQGKLIDAMILVSKQYLYACTCRNKKPYIL